MRRVVNVSDDSVTVQPGVILGQLNRQLAETGRVFGPDPANREVTTMGSVVAIDAGGSHWLKTGSVRRHVRSLKVVLASGEVAQLSRHQVTRTTPSSDATGVLTDRVAKLIDANGELITRHKPRRRSIVLDTAWTTFWSTTNWTWRGCSAAAKGRSGS